MPVLDKKIGFLGAGNMGEAFVGALTRSGRAAAAMILVSDIAQERLDFLEKRYGIATTRDNFRLFAECDVVVLAVKPQQLPALLAEIAGRPDYGTVSRKLIISIAAGIPIRKIEALLYPPLGENGQSRLPIIRVMPNTPALVLAGMSGMSANRFALPADLEITRTILDALGEVIEFDERDLDAVTALSGSGPAYVFYLIESMIRGGIANGLDPAQAAAMTLATVKGAVRLIEEQGESPETLRRKVTSPGGTTEAALKVLERHHVGERIVDAITAAADRSRALSPQD